ncbi:MAG: hypothetical protein BWY71_01162 [Planctomycetes bacterium ADurb.Bin412]|nr:MAG: hypothetical protein BWY71_01162 [Planctomycetes bacterium ADurb.Bin412]
MVANIGDALLHFRPLIFGGSQSPGDISSHTEHVIGEFVDGPFPDAAFGRFIRTILLLAGGQPLLGSADQGGIHFIDLAHVVKFHQPVGGQDAVGGGLAEPLEAAAGHFIGDQPLIPGVDETLRLHLQLGRDLAGSLHVVQHQDIRVGNGGGLFKTAEGHPQHTIQPFCHLAEDARIDLDENLAGLVDGLVGDGDGVSDYPFQAAALRNQSFLAVGNDFHRPGNRIAFLLAAGGHGEFLEADRTGGNGKIDGPHFGGGQGDGFFRQALQLEPVFLLYLELNLLVSLEVIENRHRYMHLVILGQGNRKIDIDEEILENANAGGGRAKLPLGGGGHAGHPPGGNRISQGHMQKRPAVGVGDHGGIEVERLRKILADTNRFRGAGCKFRKTLILF